MSKSQITKSLELQIWRKSRTQSVFGCFEVTIGNERVDFLTVDTKGGIWTCYEIKSSFEDFRSKASITFIGNYNYYVMPRELFAQVQHVIPEHVGVYVDGLDEAIRLRPALKCDLSLNEKALHLSMIRSLSREANRIFYDRDLPRSARLETENNKLKIDCKRYSNESHASMREAYTLRVFLKTIGQADNYENWLKEGMS